MGNIGFGFEFSYHGGSRADFVACIHYVDLLTNEKHWVERKFTFFAGKGGGPFRFQNEISLGVSEWGLYDDGQYRVDSD